MNAAQNQPLHGIRGVILDLDGTMLHTAQDIHVTINRMRSALDLTPLDLDTVIGFVGKGVESLVRSTLAVDFKPDEVERHMEQAMALFDQHYLDVNGQFATTYPGVHEGLAEMRANGLRLACVTNKPIAFALPLLKKTGLRDYFEIVYGGDSFAKKKPDPMQMLQVCADFELAPSQMVAIGDSINDAQAARAAGCKVFNVPYGYNHGQAVQDIDSDGIVSSLLQAAQLISN